MRKISFRFVCATALNCRSHASNLTVCRVRHVKLRRLLSRRFWLYLLVPVAGYAVGVALYSEDELVFWKALAAVAVFHFVRQQYGWVNLYRRKLGETANWTW